MAKSTRSNGHRLGSIAHIQLGAGTLERPTPEDLGFNLDAVTEDVVSLSVEITADAMTAQTLGPERAGNGGAIDELQVALEKDNVTVWLVSSTVFRLQVQLLHSVDIDQIVFDDQIPLFLGDRRLFCPRWIEGTAFHKPPCRA